MRSRRYRIFGGMDAPARPEAREQGGRSARGRAVKQARQRLVLKLVGEQAVGSQQQLVDLLAVHGVRITQATASRDLAELGLVRVTDHRRPRYATAARLVADGQDGDDSRLRRLLADYPVRIGRSGLTLLLLSEAGTAGAIGQAIDESTLQEQEGTLAGDNTTLVPTARINNVNPPIKMMCKKSTRYSGACAATHNPAINNQCANHTLHANVVRVAGNFHGRMAIAIRAVAVAARTHDIHAHPNPYSRITEARISKPASPYAFFPCFIWKVGRA